MEIAIIGIIILIIALVIWYVNKNKKVNSELSTSGIFVEKEPAKVKINNNKNICDLYVYHHNSSDKWICPNCENENNLNYLRCSLCKMDR